MNSIPGLIVILGSPNDQDGNLSLIGQGRVEQGYQEYLARAAAGWKILLTGGFGKHFNTTARPHAYYSRKLLLQKGVPESDIVEFAESGNSVEDALKACPIINNYQVPSLVVVTSDFHLERVRIIFQTVFPDLELCFVGSDYLSSVSEEEKQRLLAHEKQAIFGLGRIYCYGEKGCLERGLCSSCPCFTGEKS